MRLDDLWKLKVLYNFCQFSIYLTVYSCYITHKKLYCYDVNILSENASKCVCVCVCVRVCVCICMRERMHVYVCLCVCMRVSKCK